MVTVLSLPQGVHAGCVQALLRGDAARCQEGRGRGGEAGGASLAQWFALPRPAGEAGVVAREVLAQPGPPRGCLGLGVKVIVVHTNVTPGGGSKPGLSTELLFQQMVWNVPHWLGVPQERLRDRPRLFGVWPQGSVSLHRRWMRNISRWMHSLEGWIRGRSSPLQRRSGRGDFCHTGA